MKKKEEPPKHGPTQEERFEEFIERSTKLMADVRRNFQHLEDEFEEMMERSETVLITLLNGFKAHEELLKEVVRINVNVDDALGNVLLAIRQNEFLQAWYPEQLGYPEMKVSGSHPAKIKKKEAI